MKLPHRSQFFNLATGVAALSAVPRVASAQAHCRPPLGWQPVDDRKLGDPIAMGQHEWILAADRVWEVGRQVQTCATGERTGPAAANCANRRDHPYC
jgi:hypothetical protein